MLVVHSVFARVLFIVRVLSACGIFSLMEDFFDILQHILVMWPSIP